MGDYMPLFVKSPWTLNQDNKIMFSLQEKKKAGSDPRIELAHLSEI